MDQELLPPPPPYTPQDPRSQGISRPVDGPLIYIDAVNTAASPPIYTGTNFVHGAVIGNADGSYVGDNEYFRDRPPTQPAPDTVISHRLSINLKDGPEKLRYPEPAETFSARGLSKQDWLTFLNYLFPAHSTQTRHEKFNGNEKACLRTSLEPVSASAPSGLNNRDEEKNFTRRSEVHQVVDEWNAGFFLPRGLLIITMIQPYSSKDSEVNSLSSSGETALSKAVFEDNFELLQTLLFKGADPNLKLSSGTSVLYSAVEKKNFQISQLLLRHGANVDPKLLHFAASTLNDTRPLSLLLTHGANPNDTSWDSFSALYNASTRSDLPTTRLLLAYGAKPDSSPFGAHAALYNVIKRKDLPMAELLLAHGADPNLRPWGGQPVLHLATQEEDLAAMRLLLAKGAKIDTEQVLVGTALGLAVQSEKGLAAVEVLLAVGADVNIKPWAGQSPLYCAALRGDIKLMEMLLEKGAKVDDSPAGFPSALCMMVSKGDLETAKLLLRRGADVNAGTPLSIATDAVNDPLMELLLQNGADPNRKPWGGQHPLYAVSARGDTRLMKMLLEKGAKADEAPTGSATALFMAVHRGDLEAARVLLDYGADVKKKKAGYAALSWAQSQGNEEAWRLLSQYQT